LSDFPGTEIELEINQSGQVNIEELATGEVFKITYKNSSGWTPESHWALKCAADKDTKICDDVGEWEWLKAGWGLSITTWTPDLLKDISESVEGVVKTTINSKKPEKILITGKKVKCAYGFGQKDN